jgi:hypothetical protein
VDEAIWVVATVARGMAAFIRGSATCLHLGLCSPFITSLWPPNFPRVSNRRIRPNGLLPPTVLLAGSPLFKLRGWPLGPCWNVGHQYCHGSVRALTTAPLANLTTITLSFEAYRQMSTSLTCCHYSRRHAPNLSCSHAFDRLVCRWDMELTVLYRENGVKYCI